LSERICPQALCLSPSVPKGEVCLSPSVPKGEVCLSPSVPKEVCASEAALRSGPLTERNVSSGQRRRSNRPLFYGVLY
jgi:hypothetical protein